MNTAIFCTFCVSQLAGEPDGLSPTQHDPLSADNPLQDTTFLPHTQVPSGRPPPPICSSGCGSRMSFFQKIFPDPYPVMDPNPDLTNLIGLQLDILR